MIQLRKVTNNTQIQQVVDLADFIWRQHYIPIIGQQQVDYMLAKFQSAESIIEQIQQNRHYYLIETKQKPIGYLAFDWQDNPQQTLFLSKIYIDQKHRGQGLAKQTLQALIELTQCRTVLLTVNKENHIAINFYLTNGFIKRREVVADIGNGFVMDDYEMQLEVKRSA